MNQFYDSVPNRLSYHKH